LRINLISTKHKTAETTSTANSTTCEILLAFLFHIFYFALTIGERGLLALLMLSMTKRIVKTENWG
jgi:hypothetical protein